MNTLKYLISINICQDFNIYKQLKYLKYLSIKLESKSRKLRNVII